MNNVSRDLVSVIVPAYNREDFIEAAIRSVLNQTYKNFELIVVDDGSTDSTAQIVNKYAADCKYYHHKHTGNISKLRNFGLSKASGEYIAYLDADDVWETGKLQEQMDLLKNNPLKGLVFTDVIEFDGPNIIKNGLYQNKIKEDISFRNILNNTLPIYPSSILYRKTGLEKITWHDESFLWNDLGFITRFVAYNGAVMSPKKLTHIRKHNSNISTIKRNEAVGFRDMINTTEFLFKQNFLSRTEFINMSARFHSGMASMLSKSGEYKLASDAYRKALAFKPLSLKYLLLYLILNIKSAAA